MVVVNVAVLDDEKEDLQRVCDFFEETNNNRIQYQCSCFQDTNHLFDQDYDLYMIDIEMAEINGLDVAETIKEKNPKAVITINSKHKDLVFDSLKVGIFFFVRKENFKTDMEVVKNRLDPYYLENKKTYRYETRDSVRNILLSDIMYIEKKSHYIEIHLNSGEVLKDKIPINKILTQFSSFIQCHQSYLVNPYYIQSLEKNDFVMKNNEKVQISKRNRTVVRQAYVNYLNKKVTL